MSKMIPLLANWPELKGFRAGYQRAACRLTERHKMHKSLISVS